MINSLKKEIDSVEGRLQSCGGNDERQRQRQFQYRQNIKQAEESFANLAEEIESLGDIPQQDRQAASDSKERWMAQKKAHSAMRSELETTKANVARQLAAARAETSQLQQKQERLNARLNKLNAQRDGLLAANEQENQDQRRRDEVRIGELKKAENEQRQIQLHVQSVENQRLNILEQCSQIEQQLQFLDSSYAPTMPGDVATPHTPEGSYSNLVYPSNRLPSMLSTSNALQQPIGTPPAQSRRSSLLKQNRVRSSSMLSNVSGFTDDEIRTNPTSNGVYTGNRANWAREGSVGGSSGGSQGAGSVGRPENASPTPASVMQPKPSPIGAERDRNSPRNFRV